MKSLKLTVTQLDCCPELLEGGEIVLFQDEDRHYHLGEFVQQEDGEDDIWVIQTQDRIFYLNDILWGEFHFLENPFGVPEKWTELRNVINLKETEES